MRSRVVDTAGAPLHYPDVLSFSDSLRASLQEFVLTLLAAMCRVGWSW